MFKTRKKSATNLRKTLPVLRRTWVETGDARCPLACVWFALGHADAVCNTPQEPTEGERTWPALLPIRGGGQAFSSAIHLAA
jgi:hypothetical protein